MWIVTASYRIVNSPIPLRNSPPTPSWKVLHLSTMTKYCPRATKYPRKRGQKDTLVVGGRNMLGIYIIRWSVNSNYFPCQWCIPFCPRHARIFCSDFYWYTGLTLLTSRSYRRGTKILTKFPLIGFLLVHRFNAADCRAATYEVSKSSRSFTLLKSPLCHGGRGLRWKFILTVPAVSRKSGADESVLKMRRIEVVFSWIRLTLF